METLEGGNNFEYGSSNPAVGLCVRKKVEIALEMLCLICATKCTGLVHTYSLRYHFSSRLGPDFGQMYINRRAPSFFALGPAARTTSKRELGPYPCQTCPAVLFNVSLWQI
jgi:hypothetical protein